MALSLWRLPAIAPLLLAAVGLGACGGAVGDRAPTPLEATLQQTISQRMGPAANRVRCPQGQSPDRGAPFTCQLELSSDVTIAISVQATDRADQFNWNARGLLDLARASRAVADGMADANGKKTPGQPVTRPVVDCGDRLVPIYPGASFTCTFRGDRGNLQGLRLTVSDRDGNLAWQILD
jgi:hypothetical protein